MPMALASSFPNAPTAFAGFERRRRRAPGYGGMRMSGARIRIRNV